MPNYPAPSIGTHLAVSRSAAPSTGYVIFPQDANTKLGRCRLYAIIAGTPINNNTITVYDGPKSGTNSVKSVLTENNFSNNEWTYDGGMQILNGLYIDTSGTNDDITVIWLQG